MSYQKRTGALMANSHPGSYCGQDAYADLLITESPQRERERVCAMTTETNFVMIWEVSPAIRARDFKDPPIVFTRRED